MLLRVDDDRADDVDADAPATPRQDDGRDYVRVRVHDAEAAAGLPVVDDYAVDCAAVACMPGLEAGLDGDVKEEADNRPQDHRKSDFLSMMSFGNLVP